ncbi:hypothetical protein Dimus_034654 [Dionaea muscipula]
MGEKVAAAKKDEKKGGGGGDAAKKDDRGTVTVVLKFDLHCEGCAKKVRRSIKHLDGVEDVKADLVNNKLTVIGKMDPIQVKEKVEEKMKKTVELLVSPQPPKKDKEGPAAAGGKKSDGKTEKKVDDKKGEEKKQPKEPQVRTVALSTRVHCDGCGQKIKRVVGKYEGVQDVNVDVEKDLITVKGTMNIKDMLPYLNTKLKRSVVEMIPSPKNHAGAGAAADKKPKEGGGEKKEKGGKKDKEGGGDKKEKGGGGDKKEKENAAAGAARAAGDHGNGPPPTKVELVHKMDYYGTPFNDPSSSSYSNGYVIPDPSYPGQPIVVPYLADQPHGNGYTEYQHAPQMFSDENPNACSIM